MTFENQVGRASRQLQFVLHAALGRDVPQVDLSTVRLGRYEPSIFVPDSQAIDLIQSKF